MEIVYVYQRLRKEFGRAPKFTDVHSDILFEIMPNPEMMGCAARRCATRAPAPLRRPATAAAAAAGPWRDPCLLLGLPALLCGLCAPNRVHRSRD
jgi:hypothetical protein